MGKIFITDEGDNAYTANVTSSGLLRVAGAANVHYVCNSAHSLLSGEIVCSAGCYLEKVILGSAPATAAMLQIFDHGAGTAGHISGFGTSGDNVVARLGLEVSGGGASAFGAYPRTIPLGVYCISGITVGVSHSGIDSVGRVGCIKNFTVIYQSGV